VPAGKIRACSCKAIETERVTIRKGIIRPKQAISKNQIKEN
jgi:hypothetical protein